MTYEVLGAGNGALHPGITRKAVVFTTLTVFTGFYVLYQM